MKLNEQIVFDSLKRKLVDDNCLDLEGYEIKYIDQSKYLEYLIEIDLENFQLEQKNLCFKGLIKNFGTDLGLVWNDLGRQYNGEIDFKIKSHFDQFHLPQIAIDNILFDIGNATIYKHFNKELGYVFDFYDILLSLYQFGFLPIGYGEKSFFVFKLD